ncbi:MAG: hypothetical protein P4K83_11490 [Terracidiphilus sp.]|nr:hypothetical protein [Terracidiphilus sp.]
MHTTSNLLLSNANAYVLCHRGFGGLAVVGCMEYKGCAGHVTWPNAELDLTDDAVVICFFAEEYQRYGLLRGTKVGYCLFKDTWVVEFIYNYLAIQVVDNSTKKFLNI